jgi:pSer/pThr/pTyr-binding forkhead associated (FHA) protein
VPFALKVTKGPGEGSDFAFDENEAKLGRTADNDIVVKDSGASRSHCRVFAKGSRYFVEDLKSANGTKLNGSLLSQAREIKPGDTITIGDVEFTFSLPNDTGLHEPLEPDLSSLEGEDPNATLLKPPLRRDPEREKRTSRKPPTVRHDTEGEVGTVPKGTPLQEPVGNSTMEVEVQSPGKLQEDNTNSTMEVQVPPVVVRRSAAIARLDDSTRDLGIKKVPVDDATMLPRGKQASALAASKAEPEEMTAADRLRKRRGQQKSALGRVAMGWSDLPKPARIGFTAVGALFALGTVGFIVMQVIPKDTGPKKIEPTDLTANAAGTKDSFGAGDEATWQRPDMKLFNFTLASPTQVVAVLHFGARDISKDEVSITVNGAEVGFVPPDTLDATRDIEVVLPPNIVKPREQNQLVFDSTKNPPGNDPWRVFSIWIEIIPIPELSQEETARLAKDSILNADRLFDSRSIGPENLFKAWKVYREAWLLMESLPDKTAVAEVYPYARSRMRELRPMLDQKCNGLMVEYQKAINGRPPNLKMAMQLLKDVERYYPTREHPCYGFSKALLSDMEAW